MNERGRFAPSPTGELHLGNARTALLSWLWARKGGGGYAIRIEDIDTPRVPPGPLVFHDEIAADQSFDTRQLVGDFVLRRGDGIFAYQLAVVVDDGAMGITQVLRGADLLASTARQILLHRLLGQREPRWAHVPLVIAGSGERRSKRDKSLSLSALRKRGVDPLQV